MRKLILIIFFPLQVLGQKTIGVPDISNFTHNTIKAGAQTWQISQDDQGIMYFANNSGLVTYNNKEWKRFPFPNKTITRSLLVINNKIYVGGQDAIGYFQPDERGTLDYHSLMPLIPKNEQSFGDVWNIVGYNNEIFFRTSKRIFRFSKKNNRFTVYTSPNSADWSFIGTAGGVLFAQNAEEGLVYFDNNQWVQYDLPTGAGTIVTGVLDFARDTFLFTTLRDGIYLNSRNKTWKFAFNPSFENDNIYSACKPDDKTFALGTISNGIYFINRSGKIIRHFSQDNGMQNNTVLSLFVDKHSNLWAGLDEGIDLINYDAPFQIIAPQPRKNISCYTSQFWSNSLYIGTSDGVYHIKSSSDTKDLSLVQGDFEKLGGASGQVWSLNTLNGNLLMAHHDGTFRINGAAVSLVDGKEGGSWLFRAIPGTAQVMAGTYQGLRILNLRPNNIKPAEQFDNKLRESLRFIEVDSSKRLIWASHPYRGVYQFKMSADFNKVTGVKLFTKVNGLPSDLNNFVFKVNDEIVFTTESGVYEFDGVSNRFRPSEKYFPVFGNTLIKFMTSDARKRIWFATENSAGVVENKKVHYFHELDGQLIAGFENIYPVNDNNILMGSYKGLIHLNYDRYRLRITPVKVLLNKIVAISNRDSVLFNGYFVGRDSILIYQDENTIPELAPDFSSIRFEFASDRYSPNEKISYSYRLSNFDKEWSAWSDRTDKDYTNLPHGRYVFEVKAKDNLGNVSDPVRYSLVILPRWFQTKAAYAGYVALFVLLIGLTNKMHKRRLSKQKERYEKEQSHLKYVHELELEHNEKEIIQLKNEKLETEVMYKNKELATTTMHLYKRGRLIGKIKEDLSEGMATLKNKDDKVAFKQLLKLLAEEEKQDQDWEQFSIHFDQVHNNFLQNIKRSYPELTPGDLKICAYLKMNLSSKEIAQLLNISLKGVEIGRYRLRKKLGLHQDVNLTNFINEFV